MLEVPDVPGAENVLAWFGYWPTFHDAEVLSISLDRLSGCRASIHVFENTGKVDTSGYFVLAKHAVVTFYMEGFPVDESGNTNTRIDCFNHQNVLRGARINRRAEGYELALSGCYGVDGSIVCERMSITLEPGIPTGSIYGSARKPLSTR